MVCLYDDEGNIYDSVTQSYLCYQTIQASPVGKYCMPYEPISSQQLTLSLNQPDIAVNRVLSDIGNSVWTILLCVLIAVALSLVVNLMLLRTAIFFKLVGWIAIGMNALILVGFAALAFVQLSSF